MGLRRSCEAIRIISVLSCSRLLTRWYSPVISDVDVYKLFPIEIANRIYLDYSRAIKIDWNYVYEMHPVWMKRRLEMGF